MSQKVAPAAAGWRSYRRLLRYALVDWRGWTYLLLLSLACGSCSLLQPWLMQILVDHVLADKPMNPLLAWGVQFLAGADQARGLLAWVILASLGIFAFNSVLDVLSTRAWIQVGQNTVYRLAADLFARYQRRSLAFHSRNSVGDALSRITGDSWCVHSLVDTLLFTPKQALIMIAGMLVVMLQIDGPLTLLGLAIAPFMAWSSLVFGAPIRRAARRRREIESRIQAHVHQTLSGVAVVQAFGQEEREQRRFKEFTNDALHAQRRGTLISSFSGLISGLAVTLGTGLILWVGGLHVLDGRLSVGCLLVFLAYLRTLQGHLASLTRIYSGVQEIGASMDRVNELLDIEPEIVDRPSAKLLSRVTGRISFENVTFGYAAGRPVLRGVSLEVEPGQTVAVVGLSGAGKTTLASLVPRFCEPWHGRVLLDGDDIRDVRLMSLRAQIGIVFQEPYLFPLTVAANIAYGRPRASQEEIEAAARAAQLHQMIVQMPRGYDTVLGQRGASLSGGERQRLAIARAFLKNSPILILDEPTSALDSQTEHAVLQALKRLVRGRTTLIIGHRLSTIRDADRIVVLEEGRMAESGTHRELLAHQRIYSRLWRLQMGNHSREPVLSGDA